MAPLFWPLDLFDAANHPVLFRDAVLGNVRCKGT